MRYGYAYGQRMMDGPGYDGSHHDGGWGWGAYVGMALGMLILIGLVAWVIVLLTRERTPAAPTPGPDAPEAVLARRLAEGQIEPGEYRERLAALRGEGPPAGST